MGIGTANDAVIGLRVLVVEDQRDIAENVWDYLERRGYEVDHAYDGITATRLLESTCYDLIVLDLGLPRLDGIEVCRQLRKRGGTVPVLMLTARDTLDDKLLGFEVGADDYLTKPFALEELEARLRNLIRRARRDETAGLVVGRLRFDPSGQRFFRDHQQGQLTPLQARLLAALMRASPNVLRHAELVTTVWGTEGGDSTALHGLVHSLRQMIDRPFEHAMLLSVHGIGYRLVEAADQDDD